MQFIKKFFASFAQSPVTAAAPIGDQGMTQLTSVAIPQAGMERAEWYARNEPQLSRQTLGLCSNGMSAIGSNERGVQGTSRDQSFGGLMLSRHNYATFPEPITLTSADAGTVWSAQVATSKGLYDGDKEVYVNEDTQTVWA